MQLPQHLEDHFQYIQDEVKKFNQDYKRHIVDSLPRYVSIPRYVNENELDMSYDDMCEMANRAVKESNQWHKPIRIGDTSIGRLYCFLEEILDEVLKDMSAETVTHNDLDGLNGGSHKEHKIASKLL